MEETIGRLNLCDKYKNIENAAPTLKKILKLFTKINNVTCGIQNCRRVRVSWIITKVRK